MKLIKIKAISQTTHLIKIQQEWNEKSSPLNRTEKFKFDQKSRKSQAKKPKSLKFTNFQSLQRNLL